ncbi:MAG: type II toxin-antitoxin system VapC family toxin [Betaproteobacteria bacterium]|nr:type II toxin-antitoxin system VapC family toxin [Betaproteobacteria bacterium]
MFYFDTSFIAPLLLPEAASEAVEAFMRSLRSGLLATSAWTRVEFASLVSRRVRMRELDEDQAGAVRTRFAQLLSESFRVVLPGAADYDTAAMFLRNHKTGLRAGDALHLAVAHNQKMRLLYSLDAQMVGAARALGIRATDELKRPRA